MGSVEPAPRQPPAEVVPFRPRRSPVRAVVTALRPLQWTKNLLLFAGLVFAARIGDPLRWAEATAAFLVYCAAASGAYLVNDVMDAESDRLHPVKRRRPVARGELTPGRALAVSAILWAGAVAASVALGAAFLALLVCFLVLQLGYSARLKHVVLVDVLVISALFVVRASAGAVAVRVPISPWLLLCTGLLALLLALGKRRAELVLVGASETPGRPVLAGYSLPLVDQLIAAVAAATVVAYALYTLTARDSKALVVTIPFVVFGVARYLILVHRRGAGEEPEQILVTDRAVLLTAALWAATCAALLVRQ